MRKAQIEVGGKYVAKISGKWVVVEIDRPSTFNGGWMATNTETGRPVRIKTAGRLRAPAK